MPGWWEEPETEETLGSALSSRRGLIPSILGQFMLQGAQRREASRDIPGIENLLSTQGFPLSDEQKKSLGTLDPMAQIGVLKALEKRALEKPSHNWKAVIDKDASMQAMQQNKPAVTRFFDLDNPVDAAEFNQNQGKYVDPGTWRQYVAGEQRQKLEKPTEYQDWRKSALAHGVPENMIPQWIEKQKNILSNARAAGRMDIVTNHLLNGQPAAMTFKNVGWISQKDFTPADSLAEQYSKGELSKAGVVPVTPQVRAAIMQGRGALTLLNRIDALASGRDPDTGKRIPDTQLPGKKGFGTATGFTYWRNQKYPGNQWVRLLDDINAASERSTRYLVGGTSRSRDMWKQTQDTMMNPHMSAEQVRASVREYAKALKADMINGIDKHRPEALQQMQSDYLNAAQGTSTGDDFTGSGLPQPEEAPPSYNAEPESPDNDGGWNN